MSAEILNYAFDGIAAMPRRLLLCETQPVVRGIET